MEMKVVEQCPHCDPAGGKRLRFPAAEQKDCGPLARCLNCGTLYAPSALVFSVYVLCICVADVLNILLKLDWYPLYLCALALGWLLSRLPFLRRWRALPKNVPLERQHWLLRQYLVGLAVYFVTALLGFALTALLR